MRRAPSALTATGGFSVAVATVSVAATASVVLLMPDPPVVRVTVAEAAAALRGAPGSLERSASPPPDGAPAPLLQRVLAGQLGRPIGTVRVVWLDTPPSNVPTSVLVFTGSRLRNPAPTTMILRRGNPTVVHRLTPDTANAVVSGLLLNLPQPAFAAGVRGADGHWLSVAPRRPLFGGWRLKVLAALAVSLLLLAPLAWLFARRLTRPFRAMAAAIETGSEPPRIDGPRELRDAASAIVQLRTRLAREAEERVRMLTAVAHDLRTPLTSLKLRIESVSEPQRSRMVADADRMQAMVHDVLAFARVADAPRERVGIRTMVLDVIADMPGAGEKVQLSAGPELFVTVVEQAFRRAVENLIRNMMDYADGGQVDVQREAGEAVITLVDEGPGIPPGDRARLLRPFERGDTSRNCATGGVGLGLSIVQSFAALHEGSLTLADSPGGGTVVSLRLPAENGSGGPFTASPLASAAGVNDRQVHRSKGLS